jgi:predicted metal-dependent HD superfamily phosphohydrolase
MSTTLPWLQFWQALGIGDSPALQHLHRELLAAYAEPRRRYHTLQHLNECFDGVRELLPIAAYPAEIGIALWFHDAIYDPRRSDNEQRSADWARSAARTLGVAPEPAQRIHALVFSTRHAAEPVGLDAQILADVDLAILGAPPARFDEYERQVREEYAWGPEPIFRAKRSEILRSFLARPHLYHTSLFQEQYESSARRTLRRSLERLDGRGVAPMLS